MGELDDIVWTIADYMRAWGFELPEEVKQRDEREPGRQQKTRFENKFYYATRRYFKRLAEKAKRRLELHEIFYPRTVKYDPNQPRDERGRWGEGGGGGGGGDGGDGGGGRGGSIGNKQVLKKGDSQLDDYKKEVSEWESGPRRDEAIAALEPSKWDDTSVYLDDSGKVLVVATYWHDPDTVNEEGLPEGKYIRIRNMATRESGYGRQVFDDIKQVAASKNAGIYLSSLSSSRGFYESLGLNKGIGATYYLTYDEINSNKAVEGSVLSRKAINIDDYIGDDFFEDEEYDAEVIRLLLQGVGEGADLFSQEIGIPLDYSGVNKKAVAWARKYAGRLVKEIDDTTRPILRNAITMFVETPGFTIGDIMNMLTTAPQAPLTAERALRVAITETTRAYSKGNQVGAEELQAEHPDVFVTMTWWTNNDDRVCPLCGPLHDTEVEQGGTFYEPESQYEDGYPPRHVNCRCWVSYRTRIGAEYD